MLVPRVVALKGPYSFLQKVLCLRHLTMGLKGARAKNAPLLQIPERSAHLPPNKKS